MGDIKAALTSECSFKVVALLIMGFLCLQWSLVNSESVFFSYEGHLNKAFSVIYSVSQWVGIKGGGALRYTHPASSAISCSSVSTSPLRPNEQSFQKKEMWGGLGEDDHGGALRTGLITWGVVRVVVLPIVSSIWAVCTSRVSNWFSNLSINAEICREKQIWETTFQPVCRTFPP